jgi:hypothetical protein
MGERMNHRTLSARSRLVWATLGTAALLGACSNGGGDGGTTPPPPASNSRYYLLASAGPAAAGTMAFANGSTGFQSQALMAVPTPGTAGSAVVLEPAGRALGGTNSDVVAITLNGNTASNFRYHATVYARDGRLYKFEHSVPAGAAVQGQLLSSLSTSDVCLRGTALDEYADGDLGADLRNAARGWLLLRGPGADRQCNTADDVTHGVRLDMSAAAAPLTLVGEPLAPLLAADGAFNGLVMRDGNQVFRVDGNLANAGNLFSLSGNGLINLPSITALSRLWLFVDGSTLYGVRLENPSTRVALATLSGGEDSNEPQIAADGRSVFVALVSSAGSRVIRVDDNVGAPAPVATPVTTFNGAVQGLTLTPTRLVASVRNSSPGLPELVNLQSVLRSGGTARAIGTPANGESLFVYGTGGENVYATGTTTTVDPVTQQSSTRWATLIVNADGSNSQRQADTVLVGLTLPSSFSSDGAVPLYGFITASPVRPGAFGFNTAGATLRLIEGSTRNTLFNYGSLPTTPDSRVTQRTGGMQGQGLLFGSEEIAFGGVVNDLFYVQSDAIGLVRVSNFITGSALATPVATAPGPHTMRQALPARPRPGWR